LLLIAACIGMLPVTAACQSAPDAQQDQLKAQAKDAPITYQ
jgi:hypothetical protein